MFLDLLGAHESDANEALECLCKASAEGGDGSMWAIHPSPFLSTLVEAFTDNGLQVSAAMAVEVLDWLSGRMYSPKHVGAPRPPSYPWKPEELPAVHAWLASKKPGEMTFSDWSMLGDYVVSVHMPPSFAATHASWMAARASAMGRLEAGIPALPAYQCVNALASLPSSVPQMLASFQWQPWQATAMEYAAAHCAEAVTSASGTLRAGIKSAVLQEMVQEHVPGVPSSTLQTRLTDAFGRFNKDWRRIAVTEAGEAKNQGFVASLPLGARVRRMEQYVGACAFCRQLGGRVFAVVAPDARDKDGQAQVWVGKSNIGRSASPNKIVDGALVARTPDELWWPAAGVQHPHCRGMWVLQKAAVPVKDALPPDGAAAPATGAESPPPDPDWGAWLAALGLS